MTFVILNLTYGQVEQVIMDALKIDKISKSFNSVHAVDGLSASVPTGSIYGFLGPNGAGKTTTLRMIMNIIKPDSGAIEIFANRLGKNTRNRISYMPEERGLYRKMTVARVLAYFGAIKGLSKSDLHTLVPQWLQRVELSDCADKKVEELSRGMHQKLQFAATAINDPDLMILDEPFSGLDPVNLDLIKAVILDMAQKGKTILFSTHVMHQAEQICDYILLINQGKTVFDGTLDDIRSSWLSHTISVELEGDTTFLNSQPIVTNIETQGKRLEISLAQNSDPQDFLRLLIDRVRVKAFETKIPSLHEIFVNLVKKTHE